jgi:hypothetical protein
MPASAPTPRPPEPCLDCGTLVELEFCPACGQRRGDYRRPLWQLAGDLLRETLELDGRLARTLRAMLRPGRLTREYNEGRRQRYTSPVRLYLFVSVLLFATASIGFRVQSMLETPDPDVGYTHLETPRADELDEGTMLGRVLKHRLDELSHLAPAERDKQIFTGALEQGPLVMFCMLPIFALLLELVFLGTGRLYVEHLVFSLHVHTVWFLLAIPVLLLPFGWAGVLLAPIPVYTTMALQHAYAARWWTTVLRALALSILYSIALAIGLTMAFLLGMILG